MTDEEWVANMPDHLLHGYLGLSVEDLYKQDSEDADDDKDYEDDVA